MKLVIIIRIWTKKFNEMWEIMDMNWKIYVKCDNLDMKLKNKDILWENLIFGEKKMWEMIGHETEK